MELLKETDNNDDNNVISENFVPEQPTLHIDSVLSSNSASVISSSNVSPRGSEQNETDDEDKFEYDEIVSPTNSNAVYLARTIAPILTKALTETLLRRPIDPIIFIANWLTQYREKNP
ncbi:unnamed protein product [Wuchereria bancrofti]|uniref:Dpy-30 domain-containing protein n=1 Tax=Wuchereria bancrofti TaxID=6293 RepID=A0A3P7EBY9_WUCBA|nr:unnamed protein product [Wuchereria bancrofti]